MKQYLSILLGLGLLVGALALIAPMARLSSAKVMEPRAPASLGQLTQTTGITVTGEYYGLIELTHAFSGVYSDPTTPVAMDLGSLDLVLKLTQTGNAVNGYVGLMREQDLNATTPVSSLVFTSAHVINGVPVGPLVTGTFDGTLLRLQSEPFALEVAGQPIVRQFILTSTRVEDQGNILRGTYRETVWGFNPKPATVVGTFALRRPVFDVNSTLPDTPNTSPAAVDDRVVTGRNQPITINVLTNDSDADGDTLTILATSIPLHGSATTDGKAITYTPNSDFIGVDDFTYIITDGKGGNATATVIVTVIDQSGNNTHSLYLPLVHR